MEAGVRAVPLRAAGWMVLAIVAGCADETHAQWSNGAKSAVPSSSSTRTFAVGPSAASGSTTLGVPTSSAVARTEPATPPMTDGPFVTTTHLISWVFERPRLDAPHAGYLRVGRKTVRAATKTEGGPCPGAWYAVKPAGFVCEGHDGVTTRLDDPAVALAAAYPPKLDEPLPYGFGTTSGTPFYTRVPTAEEQNAREGDVAAFRAAADALRAKIDLAQLPPLTALPIAQLPTLLEAHAAAPSVMSWTLPKGAVSAGHAWAHMRLSFLTAFEADGRPFYLTTEHFIVPADRVRPARLADFRGVELARAGEEGEHLPMIWVRWRPARTFRLEAGKAVETGAVLGFQAHASIHGGPTNGRLVHGVRYFEIVDAKGQPDSRLVRADGVTRVDAATGLPWNVGADDPWIEVSLARQSLVLYHGLTPVFATLVSTGVDGAGDVETTRSTPRGQFRLHSKHWSYRMSADEHEPWKEGDKPDPRYRIDDVPYVQYFQNGYALHAAWWHDAFGIPKSHGCINLSPRDALWLFGRTEPQVPEGWYGVYAGRAGAPPGTYVIVRAW